MEKEFNVRELSRKELAETNGGFLLAAIFSIITLTYVVYSVFDLIVDAAMTYATGTNQFD